MRYYRKVLRVSYKDHVTNKEDRAKIQQAIGPHEDFLTNETQTEVAWTCLPLVRSGKNHLARQYERGKRTKQTEEEVGRQHLRMERPGVRQVPDGSEEPRKMEETGCEVIRDDPTILEVKI